MTSVVLLRRVGAVAVTGRGQDQFRENVEVGCPM